MGEKPAPTCTQMIQTLKKKVFSLDNSIAGKHFLTENSFNKMIASQIMSFTNLQIIINPPVSI